MSIMEHEKGEFLTHPFGPLYGPESKVLILGSFPSVKSREIQFFYGHPQNRFWKVIAALLEKPVPVTVDEKRSLIIDGRLALWDTIGRCEIRGSSDSSIRNVTPNDLSVILGSCDIRKIFCNGKTSFSLYQKYIEPVTGIRAECLPSTSPANAAWSLQALTEEWKKILQFTY